MHYLGL
ncbi:hypothetical protein YPPY48_3347, partial [Yersinia pestis PY-48]